MSSTQDTIAAIATPPGRGGVGIIRISGPLAKHVGEAITDQSLTPRRAHFAEFKQQQELIDTGIALYFKAPNSFTGEDVVELQGHGGPVIQDLLLKAIIAAGARSARAGEFTERAFLNDKIDLAQAEAIADLIDSTTQQAAKGAVRSLQGEFSNRVHSILEQLIHLRMYVEAAIDFPEEEIDFLADEKVANSVSALRNQLTEIREQANQGAILRNGLQLVIAGRPNAGKSSLLNALAGQEAAIVTDIPGTTRDVLSQTIDIDGLPVHILDTAGLRDSDDTVEKLGINRAKQAIESADHILFLVDAADDSNTDASINQQINELNKPSAEITLVLNKADLLHTQQAPTSETHITISAKQQIGLEELKAHIKKIAGYRSENESLFTARRRHLTALENAAAAVDRGLEQLRINIAGELLADELLQAQNELNQITGEFSADDLLGEIFRGFCIGK